MAYIGYMREGQPSQPTNKTMNLKALALAAVAATGIGFAAPAEARGMCTALDRNDNYTNVRATPNGQQVWALGNGIRVEAPRAWKKDAQGRFWGFVNYGGGSGWVIGSNLACDRA